MDIQKRGSLRFWGDWFGRPMDDCHIPLSAGYDAERDILTIRFDDGGRCTVYAPRGIVNEPKTFRIQSARKVVWEWNYYGRQQTPENLYRKEYTWDHIGLWRVDYHGERIISKKVIAPQGHPAVEIG